MSDSIFPFTRWRLIPATMAALIALGLIAALIPLISGPAEAQEPWELTLEPRQATVTEGQAVLLTATLSSTSTASKPLYFTIGSTGSVL